MQNQNVNNSCDRVMCQSLYQKAVSSLNLNQIATNMQFRPASCIQTDMCNGVINKKKNVEVLGCYYWSYEI